jgi:hypothetical protein
MQVGMYLQTSGALVAHNPPYRPYRPCFVQAVHRRIGFKQSIRFSKSRKEVNPASRVASAYEAVELISSATSFASHFGYREGFLAQDKKQEKEDHPQSLMAPSAPKMRPAHCVRFSRPSKTANSSKVTQGYEASRSSGSAKS